MLGALRCIILLENDFRFVVDENGHILYSIYTMKLIGKLIIVLVLFVFSLSPVSAVNKVKSTPAPINVNSYELFWPIVAGKVQGDKMYALKIFKEKLRGRLVFSNIKKAEYNIILSEKRLLEFEKLAILNKDFENSAKTLGVFKSTQEESVSRLELAQKEGLDITVTSQMVSEVFDKEASLLQSILSKIDESQKESVTDAITNTASLSARLK